MTSASYPALREGTGVSALQPASTSSWKSSMRSIPAARWRYPSPRATRAGGAAGTGLQGRRSSGWASDQEAARCDCRLRAAGIGGHDRRRSPSARFWASRAQVRALSAARHNVVSPPDAPLCPLCGEPMDPVATSVPRKTATRRSSGMSDDVRRRRRKRTNRRHKRRHRTYP